MIKKSILAIILFIIFQLGFTTECPQGELYQVYFSQVYSGSPKEASKSINSIDKNLVNIIDKANIQIYAALHKLNLYSVTDALIRAHKRGVEVKLVIQVSYSKEKSIIRLKDAGIPVMDNHSAEESGLMHNKFLVIDSEWVWTGSLNTTYNCSFKNNNNAILFHSNELAINYLDKFKDLFFNKNFGVSSQSTVKYKKVQLDDGTVIRTYFAPKDNVSIDIVNEIKKAKSSIRFLAFSFTHKNIADAIIASFKGGVKVEGVVDRVQGKNKYSKHTLMQKLGIDVRVSQNKYKMHHKVIIIDNQTTIMGSFNFSNSADRQNDENLLIIESKAIAESYNQEFECIYNKN